MLLRKRNYQLGLAGGVFLWCLTTANLSQAKIPDEVAAAQAEFAKIEAVLGNTEKAKCSLHRNQEQQLLVRRGCGECITPQGGTGRITGGDNRCKGCAR